MFLRSFPSIASLSFGAAEIISKLAQKAIAERGRFTIALSGGSTPRTLYETLSREYHTKIDWKHVHIFWGDERYVPHDDYASNYRMAKGSLLDKLDIPSANVHPIPTSFADPKEAAASYANELTSFFGQSIPEFDLILLGLGSDGHTASIFPQTPLAKSREGLVIVTESPVTPIVRISLTMNVLDTTQNVFFLVSVDEKSEILKAVLAEEGSPDSKYPAARVRPRGELVWFVDEARSRDL